MIIGLYLDRRAHCPRLPRPLEENVIWAHSLQAFAQRMHDAEVGLLLLGPGAVDSGTLGVLRNWIHTHRLIAVAAMRKGAIRALLDLGLGHEDIVWADELPEGLELALRRHRMRDPFKTFIEALILDRRPPPIVEAALRRTCAELAPPVSVTALARGLGVAESTFRYHWRKALPDVSPKELLEWALLTRMIRFSGRATIGAIQQLGVHERTLARTTKRVVGLTTSEVVSEGGRIQLTSSFHEWVIRVRRGSE